MTRNIVSFDFDGVLHSSLEENSLNPISHTEWNLTPCYKMHELLKKEYNDGNDIIIVSARSETYENGIDIVKRAMWRFINHYDLP